MEKIKTYNTPETLLVITSYPNPADGSYGRRDFNAVGWHSEKGLPYIARFRKVLVCAEKIGTRKYFSPLENLLVARVWKKGNILSLLRLYSFILKQDKISSILVQFEFNILGGIIPNLTLLLILMLLRLSGKHITFEAHQVITDIGKLVKHVHITNPLMQHVFNVGLRLFYIAVGIIANTVIVFEEEMKIRLQRFIAAKKIQVLSLFVNKQSVIPAEQARKKIGISKNEFVLLVFGYINGYKGIDWIMQALKKTKGKNLRLLMVGGKNPYLKNTPHYEAFYNAIVDEARKQAHFTYVDFVPDDKISLYFSAADLVVMPYTVCISASGPFSHALGYNKPVILSEKLYDYSKSIDFKKAMQEAKIEQNDLFFTLTKETLLHLINRAKNDSSYYKKLVAFSSTLADIRSFSSMSRKLDLILFPPREASILQPDKVKLPKLIPA